MKVQMFESKSPFKGQQIKLGLAAVLGSAAFLLGGCSQNLGINSGTDQAQAEEESAVVDYTCISNPDSEKKITVYFISCKRRFCCRIVMFRNGSSCDICGVCTVA